VGRRWINMITVNVSELLQVVKQMSSDGMDCAVLDILDPIPEENAPAALGFSAFKKSDMIEIDYDEIDSV
jgi:hypothetical protein